MADDASNIDVLNATAQTQLKTIIERIERLEEEKAAVMADLKEVFSEAKGNGFDPKIIRKVVRLRKQDTAKRQEEESITDLYLSAIGGL
ncbi:MAG: nucleoid-associated protein GapR [Caulobacteraceae bacterium]